MLSQCLQRWHPICGNASLILVTQVPILFTANQPGKTADETPLWCKTKMKFSTSFPAWLAMAAMGIEGVTTR